MKTSSHVLFSSLLFLSISACAAQSLDSPSSSDSTMAGSSGNQGQTNEMGGAGGETEPDKGGIGPSLSGNGGAGETNPGAGTAGNAGTGGSDGIGKGNGTAGAPSDFSENCFNGEDDNNDGLIDCEDASCKPFCSDLCNNPKELSLGVEQKGSLSGRTSTYQATCLGEKSAISIAYKVTATEDGQFHFALFSGGDLALSAYQASCSGGGYAYCSNSVGEGGSESITVDAKKGEDWYLVVSATEGSEKASFSVLAKFDVPFCGDGKLSPGEKCDDGNNLDGDGCSANCQVDSCTSAIPLADPPLDNQKKAPPPAKIKAFLKGENSSLHASCSGLGAKTVSQIHSFRSIHSGRLEVSVIPEDPENDLILSVRSSCAPEGELVCSDAASGGAPERLSLPIQAGQPVYFMVEGDAKKGNGGYELQAQTLPVSCGDGLLVKSVEQCDPASEEKECTTECTRLSSNGDSSGSSVIAPFPSSKQSSGSAIGRIFPAGDADRFSIEVPSGKKVKLTIADPTSKPDCANGRLDSQIEVFDANGVLVAFNDDMKGAKENYCSELTLEQAGNYTVQIRSSQRSSPAQVFSYKLVKTVF